MLRVDQSSRGVLPSVVCLTERDREATIMMRLWPTGGGAWAVAPWGDIFLQFSDCDIQFFYIFEYYEYFLI